MNDIVVEKIQSIQRCVRRAREEYRTDPVGFETNFTAQDAALLNVLRACEQAIDLANHVVRSYKLGIPTSSAASFDLLQEGTVIDLDLAHRLRRMVSFRNLLIHQYQQIDLALVRVVITTGLDDLVQLCDRILLFTSTN
jgi:uncharacterized protein YutE (UPF0331/DUF86 family)